MTVRVYDGDEEAPARDQINGENLMSGSFCLRIAFDSDNHKFSPANRAGGDGCDDESTYGRSLH